MSIKIKAVSKKNPSDLAAAPKFYATIVSSGKTDLDRLTQLVSDGSTVREADIYAVIIGLVNAIEGELADGKSVDLGKLGTFRLSVNSTGSATAAEVSASNINKTKILYRPGKSLQDRLKTLKYQKVQEL